MGRKTLLLVTVIIEGGLFLLGLLLMGDSRTEVWSTFSISWVATSYTLLFCLPMFAVLYFAMKSSWEPFARLRRELEEKIRPIFTNCKVIDLAVIALFAGVGEELFFRGWMQGTLTDRFGIWVGILITSLIFGLVHYLSFEYAVYAFITGIYLGLIYSFSGNLFVVMMIHGVYDFVALAYLFFLNEKTRGVSKQLHDVAKKD